MAGYVSPIPMRRATLGDALASEWTKIRSVRSTLWTLGVMVALILGIGVLFSAIAAASGDDIDAGDASPLGFGVFGVLLGLLCVVTLGVLTISAEYGTGMIRTTLTACPDRARVLTAKALVFFLLVFATTVVSTLLVAMIGSSLLADHGLREANGSEWLRGTVGVSLFVALVGLIALAIGTLVRHSAGAITAMLGVVLLPLILTIFMAGETLADVREFLATYSIPVQLFALYSGNSDDISGDVLPFGTWSPVLIMLGIAAAALAAAYASLLKRDA
ncbi:ABC transporter permease subunit [Streptomyces stramineus]